MPIVTSGPFLGFSGTVDGMTYSQMADGRTMVKRKNKKSTKPPTPKQLEIKNDTGRCASLMRPLKEFVRVGYELEAKKKPGLNTYNAMVQQVRKNAFQDTGEGRKFDFSKVLMTMGNMPSIEESAVEITPFGVAFTWSTELIASTTHYSDQVVMMAYFPDLGQARYITAGAQRFLGKDLLMLEGIKKGYTAEIYISFITNDRTAISNSTYLGQLNW